MVLKMLKAGFSQVDMTPKLGLHIPGYFSVREADGVTDPLYARACAFDDGENVFAIVVLDLLYISTPSVEKIRRRTNELCGIPENCIMVACTHTHTGPPTDRYAANAHSYEENTNRIIDNAADALTMAYKNRVDAKLGFGNQNEYSVAFNRRYYMKDGSLRTNPGILNPNVDRAASPIDPEVGVLRVDDADGNPIGALVNFAVHADCVTGTKYCSDYIGELSRTLKKIYGEKFGVVFMNGCCGDINHYDVLGGTNLPAGKHHLRMGKILAGDALAIIERTLTSGEVKLKVGENSFKGTRRRPTQENFDWAEKVLASENPSNTDKSYANAYISMRDNPLSDPTVVLQAAHFEFTEPMKNGVIPGDVAICSMPGEIFVEIGLDLKAQSPCAHTMVCELANECYGYISTARGIEEGGYEARISRYTNMDKDTAALLVSTHVELLNRLK